MEGVFDKVTLLELEFNPKGKSSLRYTVPSIKIYSSSKLAITFFST